MTEPLLGSLSGHAQGMPDIGPRVALLVAETGYHDGKGPVYVVGQVDQFGQAFHVPVLPDAPPVGTDDATGKSAVLGRFGGHVGSLRFRWFTVKAPLTWP